MVQDPLQGRRVPGHVDFFERVLLRHPGQEHAGCHLRLHVQECGGQRRRHDVRRRRDRARRDRGGGRPALVRRRGRKISARTLEVHPRGGREKNLPSSLDYYFLRPDLLGRLTDRPRASGRPANEWI